MILASAGNDRYMPVSFQKEKGPEGPFIRPSCPRGKIYNPMRMECVFANYVAPYTAPDQSQSAMIPTQPEFVVPLPYPPGFGQADATTPAPEPADRVDLDRKLVGNVTVKHALYAGAGLLAFTLALAIIK